MTPATTTALIAALWPIVCQVESGGDPNAYNAAEEAAGIAQIRPIMVEDVNRIAGCPVFSLENRFESKAAREMFRIYMEHYGAAYTRETGKEPTLEVFARLWPGGPNGWKQDCTDDYWKKIKAAQQQKGRE